MFHTDEKDTETGAGGLGFRGRSTDRMTILEMAKEVPGAMAGWAAFAGCMIKMMFTGQCNFFINGEW